MSIFFTSKVVTSVDTIRRLLQAPSKTDMVKFAANHLNDKGTGFLYCLVCSLFPYFDDFYTKYCMNGLDIKESEIDKIKTKLKQYFEEHHNERVKSFVLKDCFINGKKTSIYFIEREGRIEIHLGSLDSACMAEVPNTSFADVKAKVCELTDEQQHSPGKQDALVLNPAVIISSTEYEDIDLNANQLNDEDADFLKKSISSGESKNISSEEPYVSD